MHRCETGREGRALNTIVSNQPESAAKGAAFASARAAALRVMGADALRGAVFLEGGLAPWLASGRDSGRLHGDVDFSVRLRDMPAVREWLAGEGLYDRLLDSLDLACNASRADFGVHAIVGGVPVSFCPFSFDGGALIQRNAALRRFEGFDALFEARIPGIAEEDFVETRRLPSVGAVGFSTLEACRAAKGASGRPKDAADIGEIDRIGVDPARLGRVEAAFSRMRVECVAHEGAEGGSHDPVPDSAHWVRGVLDAACELGDAYPADSSGELHPSDYEVVEIHALPSGIEEARSNGAIRLAGARVPPRSGFGVAADRSAASSYAEGRVATTTSSLPSTCAETSPPMRSQRLATIASPRPDPSPERAASAR